MNQLKGLKGSNPLKKVFVFTLVVFYIGLLIGTGTAGDLAKVIKDGKIKMAMSGQYPPFNFVDAQNRLTGFDVQISLGDLLYEEKMGIALRKNNKELKAAINSALATMKKDGTYHDISMHWLGIDVR